MLPEDPRTLPPSRAPQTIGLLKIALSAQCVSGSVRWMVLSAIFYCNNPQSAVVCGVQRSGGSWQHAMVSRRDKHCLCASGAEVAEPAQCATELAPVAARRLAGPSRPNLGASALAGRRLAGPRPSAGLRKASELFKHSCAIYSRNEPFGFRVGSMHEKHDDVDIMTRCSTMYTQHSHTCGAAFEIGIFMPNKYL